MIATSEPRQARHKHWNLSFTPGYLFDFPKQLSTSTVVINSACAKFPRFYKTKVKIL